MLRAARDILKQVRVKQEWPVSDRLRSLNLSLLVMGSYGFYEQDGKRARLVLWKDH